MKPNRPALPPPVRPFLSRWRSAPFPVTLAGAQGLSGGAGLLALNHRMRASPAAGKHHPRQKYTPHCIFNRPLKLCGRAVIFNHTPYLFWHSALQCGRDTGAVSRIGLAAVGDMALLDLF